MDRVCELCGGPLRRDNTTGVCRRNPECVHEYTRRSEARRQENPEAVRVCELCGGPLSRNNATGVCQRNPACGQEYMRRYQARWRAENPEAVRAASQRRAARLRTERREAASVCELCGVQLRADNRTGVCRGNPECMREWGRRTQARRRKENPEAVRAHKRDQYQLNREAVRERTTAKRGTPDGARATLLYSARSRSKRARIPCTLQLDDIPAIPAMCPACRKPMRIGNRTAGGEPDSPSLDRIRPVLGYIPGNVWIICRRCNAIKNDASPEELDMIAHAVRQALEANGEGVRSR